MEYLKKFGDTLKDLINEKEIDVHELSKTIDVDESVIYRWCKNSSIPNFNNLIRLANYFQCSVDYLIGIKNEYHFVGFKQCPPFCNQLRMFKEKDNLTIYRICKDTKIARYTLTRCLQGKRLPLVDNLIRLAEYFDCSVDHLVGREE